MYHNFSAPGPAKGEAVSVAAARNQLTYLRRHFSVVPLCALLEQLGSGKPLLDRTVAITIDDGRRNCYGSFFPLLRELGIPATFFVVSSFIRGEDWIWTDKVLWLSDQGNRPPDLAPGRIESFFAMLNQMRPEARNARVVALASNMGINIPKEPPLKYAPCSWTELREMADSGLVEIGSHTVTHPILATIGDNECWEELTISRAQIEEGLGRKIRLFCFPNGKPCDYRPNQLWQVKEAGYAGAVVTSFGMVDRGADLYQLPRIGVSGKLDHLTFRKYVDGVELYQSRFLPIPRRGN
jgi:peptidoglycan/xylan/chitin deacetylase (PgdA/CDA1 family)